MILLIMFEFLLITNTLFIYYKYGRPRTYKLKFEIKNMIVTGVLFIE